MKCKQHGEREPGSCERSILLNKVGERREEEETENRKNVHSPNPLAEAWCTHQHFRRKGEGHWRQSACKSQETKTVCRGHLEIKMPRRTAWDSSLLSHWRIRHCWTQGFSVSLETFRTCVGVKVGRLKTSLM